MVVRDPLRTTFTRTTATASGGFFTVGICATGSPGSLPQLLSLIQEEAYPQGMELRKIVVVASECSVKTVELLRRAEEAEPRMILLGEDRREGKAAAINKVIQESEGDLLVLVNADALPAKGAISRLLRAIHRDERIGMVSASPVIEVKTGMASMILELMWSTHDACAQDLDQTGLSNHGTDELMAVRLGVLAGLPEGVVNDGAFIAGRLRAKGWRIRTLKGAAVKVDVPSRPIDIIRQRRRILYGHLQVWRLVGRVPATAESLMIISPRRGISSLVRTLSRRPNLIPALPFALVGEFISFAGATLDNLLAEEKHSIWERYGD